MIEYFVTPCNYVEGMDFKHEEITLNRLNRQFDHIMQEVEEAKEALNEFSITGTGKARANLGAEIADIMTSCATMLYAMSRMEGAPPKFDVNCIGHVKLKNAMRGYVR